MSSSSDDLEVIIERAGGLDVHKDMVAACVRVPDGAGGVVKHIAEFPTFTEDSWRKELENRAAGDR